MLGKIPLRTVLAVWLFGIVKCKLIGDSDRSNLTGILYFWVRSLRYSGTVPLSTWNV